MNQETPTPPPQQSSVPTTHAPRDAPSRPPAMFWAVAIVIVVAMVCGTYLLGRVLNLADKVAAVPSQIASVPARIAEGIALAFKPTVNVRTTIDTTIASIREESKLVVLQTSVNVLLQRSSEKSTLWGKLYLGTTTVNIRALDNRVQYYVALEHIEASDLQFEPETNKLIMKIPQPRLDEDLVEVQTDPAKITVQTDVGWARLDNYSGKFLRDEALRELRPSVIQQGNQSFVLDRARESARQDMLKLLSPLLDGLRDDVKVEVRFKE